MLNVAKMKIYVNGSQITRVHSLAIKFEAKHIHALAELVILNQVMGKWVPGEPVLCFVDYFEDETVFLRQVSSEVKLESKKVTHVDFGEKK